MGTYAGGGTGSGDTHIPQMISGGKKVAAKKVAKKAAVKKAAKATVGKESTTARAMRNSAVTTPRMRGMSKTPPQI